MKKLTAYEWAALGLSILFLICCACWLLFHYTHPAAWQVRTERYAPTSVARPNDEINTDGLLPGELIDLNAATRSDLLRLPDVGAVRADAILAHREANGPFADVDALTDVPGIGPTTLERLRPYLCAG